MAKARVEIPDEVAASVLFQADRTCCVCQERGKSIQLHHVDEDPANNDFQNLAVLCLECHNLTQITGGFGRRLDRAQILKFRDNWHHRVGQRRDRADTITSSHGLISARDTKPPSELRDPSKLINYFNVLPAIRRDAYQRAHSKWDTGRTPTMKQGNSDVIDIMQQILTSLAAWYPPLHFDDLTPEEYFSTVTATRFRWHWSCLRALGSNSGGGTMLGPMVGGSVLDDLERMVEEIVFALYLNLHISDFHFDNWKEKWQAASN
jgi:hypothetical protein